MSLVEFYHYNNNFSITILNTNRSNSFYKTLIYGTNINLAKNNDIIILVDKYTRKVTSETHNFNGFVRFKYASYVYISNFHQFLI
ncbi:DUF4130 domain-containing protein [Clostridium autoethanogenum]|uniref:DUF4130 domain-containing protein n=1 Tax=Clostridium autoethanogenum DSM 10061 TaxID=1341692 RepID=A0ABY4TPK2_9CLOT|nr:MULTISPECIES: DUF4130 domain-containing protein [Clostridium]URS74471.1 DUF4130 domain-containing protein [Clostridium autoethanogenum DSM 10061]